MRVIGILSLVLLSIAGGVPPQEGAPDFECPTCDGEGTVEVACWACAGQKKGPCYQCLPSDRWPHLHYDTDPGRDGSLAGLRALIDEAQSPEEWLLVTERIEAQKSYREGMRLRGRIQIPREGWLKCRNWDCAEGFVKDRELPCKPCKKKGWLPCPICGKKGVGKCARCRGTGKARAGCLDCVGSGLVWDPRTLAKLDPEICGWCRDLGRRLCLRCDDEGKMWAACEKCAGTKKRACPYCRGLGHEPCGICQSTGLHPQEKYHGRPKPCFLCRGKGKKPCEKCRRKRIVICTACGKKGDAQTECGTCAGEKALPCEGCRYGGYRYWEVTGRMLLDEKLSEEAAAHFATAYKRCRAYHRARITAAGDDDEARGKAEQRRDHETERVGAMFEAAAAELDDG